jgi:hypothetical protein
MEKAMTTVTSNYTPAKNLSPFFEVTRCPLTTTLNGKSVDVARDALFSPKGDLMGVVSPRYKVITNAEVVNVFDEFFSTLNVYSVKDMVSGNGSKWVRSYILNDDKYTVAVAGKDELKMMVSIHNGYDGKSAVGMYFSAWRKVCSNGMMGWKKLIGKTFSHFTNGILDQLRAITETGFNNMKDNFVTWEEWAKTPFTQTQFMGFIDEREYLSDKQKTATKDLYLPIMNKYGEEETKWGAYNVITAIATHYTSSRNKNVDNIFSSGYKTMDKVAKDFYLVNKAA